jgi:hypothetical protein
VTIVRRIFLLALLVPSLAACGGSGDGDDEVVPPVDTGVQPSRAEFIRKGDAVCRQILKEAEKIDEQAAAISFSELSNKNTQKVAARIWAQQIALTRKFKNRLESFGAPPGSENEVSELIATLEKAIGLGEEIRGQLASGRIDDTPVFVQEYASVVEQGNQQAQSFGFEVCGAAPQ